MSIRVKAISPKSTLRRIVMPFTISGLSAGNEVNVGVLPYDAALTEMALGSTAAASGTAFNVLKNGVSAASFTPGDLAASAGVVYSSTQNLGAWSAGSYIRIGMSATTASKDIIGYLKFLVCKDTQK